MCDNLYSSPEVSDTVISAGVFCQISLDNYCGIKVLKAHLKELLFREYKHTIIYLETEMERNALRDAGYLCRDFL